MADDRAGDDLMRSVPMLDPEPGVANDTFTDAYGRCFVAGEPVPQAVYERHVRLWHTCAEVIARLWQFAAVPHTRPVNALFDPPLDDEQTTILDRATRGFYPDAH